MEPIDLQATFGQRYKIGRDPAYFAEYGKRAKVRDPWYDVLLCRHGEICPWGGPRIAASTHTNGPVANRLRRAPFCRVEQDGDDGVTVTFHVDDFAKVARIMKPRRAKRPSAAELRSLAEGRRKLALKPLGGFPKSRRQRAQTVGCGS